MDNGGAPIIGLLDIAALLWFLIAWIGYVAYTKRCNIQNRRGLLAAMNRVREQR